MVARNKYCGRNYGYKERVRRKVFERETHRINSIQTSKHPLMTRIPWHLLEPYSSGVAEGFASLVSEPDKADARETASCTLETNP